MDEKFIIKTPALNQKPKGGLGVELFRSMKMHKDKTAQYNVDSESKDTYESLLTRCVRTAIKMRSEGIKTDEIVCLCTYNHENSSVPFIASQFLGNKVASLDPILSLDDTSYLLQQVKPTIIFVIPESINLIEKAIERCEIHCKIVVFGESLKHERFSEYLHPNKEEINFKVNTNVKPEDTAVIFFSSGTTGFPKGICQSHYALWGQAVTINNYGLLGSISLYYSSLYWISAADFLVGSILSGKARVISKKFNHEQIWHLIDKFKISFLFLAPNQASEMCKAGRPENIDTSSLLSVITAGGPLSEKYTSLLRDLLPGTFVTQAYGQTETAGILTSFKMNDVKDALLLHYKPTSCGRPISGVFYKVVDPETEEVLGPNQHGELRVKSKFIMNGYHNLDSSDSFDKDGWLRTGDIMYYDSDLCFYVVDRIKEMLKFRSWHIAPAMLENILSNHPSVKKSVVIGVPHEEDGDHPMAIIILNNPQDEITAEEIEQFVAQQVDDWQRLRGGVKFVNSIPLTPTGKVKRRELRKLVLSGEL